jgi:photosystem II stability/assembly factor-like uncharacterized protein
MNSIFSVLRLPKFVKFFSIILLSGAILFSMLLFFQSVQAGTESWVSQGSGPGGTSTLSIAVDPQTSSILYAGTIYGIYKSTDSGDNWVNITNDLLTYYGVIPGINEIVFHPQLSNTLYLGSRFGGGVFKSINGGQNWTAANDGITTGYVETLVIDPQNPAILYAGTKGHDGQGGIFKSSNNGESWAAVNTGLPLPAFVYSIAIDPQNTNTLYAGLHGAGIYKSINSGDTWTALNTSTAIKFSHVLLIDPDTTSTIYAGTADNGLFKSENSGTTFTAINDGIEAEKIITAIWQVDASTIYAGTENGGVYKSIDAGDTWEYSSSGLNSSYIQCLTGVDNDSSIIYTGTGGGISKTIDSGVSWNDRNYGLPAAKIETLLLLPQEPYSLYAGTDNGGVYEYQDENWISKSSGITNTWIRSLEYDPITPTTLYAGTFFSGIYKSIDGGSSWIEQNTGLPTFQDDVRDIIVHPTTPTTVYAGLQSGVYKSIDGGDNWVESSTGMPIDARDIYSLTMDPNNPENLYASIGNEGVYKTTDGGQNWNASNNGLTNFYVHGLAVDPSDSSIVYAGGEGRLFRSIDSGATWTPNDLDHTVFSIVFNPSEVGTLYAGTEGWGVYKSIDNGLSWESMTTNGIPGGNAYIYDLELDMNTQKLYAATMFGTQLTQNASTTPHVFVKTIFSEPNKLISEKSDIILPKAYGVFALCISEECEAGNFVNIYLPMIIR